MATSTTELPAVLPVARYILRSRPRLPCLARACCYWVASSAGARTQPRQRTLKKSSFRLSGLRGGGSFLGLVRGARRAVALHFAVGPQFPHNWFHDVFWGVLASGREIIPACGRNGEPSLRTLW